MFRKFLLPAALGIVAAGAFLPSAASAQDYFGFSVGSGYPVETPGYYYAPGYYDDRRDAWFAHHRWEQHERWEREEARRRYWQHERWEHRRWHHDDDDDGD